MKSYRFFNCTIESAEAKNGTRNDILAQSETFPAPAEEQPFIARCETSRKYMYFNNIDAFIKRYTAGEIGHTIHELVRGNQYQKVKFDIDAEVSKLDAFPEVPALPLPVKCIPDDFFSEDLCEDFYQSDMAAYNREMSKSPAQRKFEKLFAEICEAISYVLSEQYNVFVEPKEFIVCDSSNPAVKFSRHVLIPKYYIEDVRECAYITQCVLDKVPHCEALIDAQVNSANHSMRVANSHKVGDVTRVKRIAQPYTFEDSLITHVKGLHLLGRVAIQKIGETVKDCRSIVANDAEVNALVFAHYPDMRLRKRTGSLYVYDSTKAFHCGFCECEHTNDNKIMARINASGEVIMFCRNTKDASKVIGNIEVTVENAEDLTLPKRDYNELVEKYSKNVLKTIPNMIAELTPKCKFTVENVNVQSLSGNTTCDLSRAGTYIVKSDMKTSKSKMIREQLVGAPADVNKLLVSFRRSFTTDCMRTYGDFEFVDYRNTTREITAKNAIVQLESLFRYERQPGPLILILDESESILEQFESNLSGDDIAAAHSMFVSLMESADTVVLMDAFVSERTLDLVNELRESATVLCNDFHYEYTDYYYEDKAALRPAMLQALRAGQKIAFVTNSCSEANEIEKFIRKNMPAACIGKYTGRNIKESADDLVNVNESWMQYDLVIYTSTITAGISFEREHFTKVFAYFSSYTTDHLTAIQMLGRIRSVVEYHISVKEHFPDLPANYGAVKRALESREGINRLKRGGRAPSAYLGLRITRDGRFTYPLVDELFRIHINNIVSRAKSANNYLRNLVCCRKAMGAKCIGVAYIEDVALEDQIKEIKKEVRAEHYDAIVESENLDDFTYELAKFDHNPTYEVKCSLKKYEIAATTMYAPAEITPAIIEVYDKPHLAEVRRNLDRTVRFGRENVLENAFAAADVIANNINEGATVGTPEEARFKAALGILTVISDGAGLNDKRFIEIYHARAVIETRMKTCADVIDADKHFYSREFDIRMSKLRGIKTASVKQVMGVVNKILSRAFDLTIKSSRSDSNMFQAKTSNLFILDEVQGCYRAPRPRNM